MHGVFGPEREHMVVIAAPAEIAERSLAVKCGYNHDQTTAEWGELPMHSSSPHRAERTHGPASPHQGRTMSAEQAQATRAARAMTTPGRALEVTATSGTADTVVSADTVDTAPTGADADAARMPASDSAEAQLSRTLTGGSARPYSAFPDRTKWLIAGLGGIAAVFSPISVRV